MTKRYQECYANNNQHIWRNVAKSAIRTKIKNIWRNVMKSAMRTIINVN